MSVGRRAWVMALATATASFGLLVPSATAGERAWGGCDPGDICVYNGLDGQGDVCAWDGNDIDWWTEDGSGSSKWVCKWAQSWDPRPGKVKSIWNRGNDDGSPTSVKFYFNNNYRDYYACAYGAKNGKPGFKGNTGPDAGVKLQSHKWVSSC
ncbi:peptidase inhibitor family I36 protein [Streptomyces sp. NPDC041068]|uniref:peptidase inhibitor family I36 protein n=1 Tax=Streptomyces sp. NPDC041068 TaxID=3155130 RepID=UPI0033FDE28C